MSARRFRRRALARAGMLGVAAVVVIGGQQLVVPAPAFAATTNPAPAAGARANATRLGFTVSGTAGLSVDVATGNAEFTDQLLTLPGVTSDVPVALAWNSTVVGTSIPSAVTGTTGSGWAITGFDQRLIKNSDGSLTYYGPGGLTGVFTPISGSTGFTAPPQFQATLVPASGAGWTMTMHASGAVLTFAPSGNLNSVADRNGNLTTFTAPYDGQGTIFSSRGTSATRRLQFASNTANQITSMTQTSGSLTRTVTLGYTNGTLTSVVDTAGGTTTFAYTGSQLTTVTNPAGATTTVTYSGAKATAVAQSNTATGSPGTSTTRLSYPSPSQTLVADPTTNQTQAVSAVAHTTYALTTDGTMLVASATDPDGDAQSATYNPQNNAVLTQTSAAGGQSSYTYGANSGESLTQADSPGGAKGTASYTNTGSAQYEPNSTTNSAGNQLSYTYNGAGNALTSAAGSGPTASVGYNSLGQPTSSASPGAPSGVKTTYAYDSATHNLTGITPVTGTALGARAYTWDTFGRLATATDGRGNTTTYTYDKADRITAVAYSDTATHGVTYTYDSEGRVTKRVDGSGTTTYTYDDLGRLLTTSNTAGGGTETYTYDAAGAMASKTDSGGTTTYTYSPAHRVLTLNYPQNGGTLTTAFGYDTAGRRTDVWLQTNAAHTAWSAHEQTAYDTSGRVTAVLGQRGPATAPTTVVSQTACYNATSPGPTCSTTPAGDRSSLQFVTDYISGETAHFAYDNNATGQGQTGRLLTTTITGGANPRTYTYVYNAAGDRTTASVTGTSPTTQTLTYNNANQITTTGYTYDAAGNRTASPTETATYNTAGQTTSATAGSTTSAYTYAGTNADELLTATNEAGHTYKFTYGTTDQNGLPQIEQVAVSGSSVTAYVQHDPTTGAPLMLQTNTQISTLYMTDITGNPILLATSAQATSYSTAYDPYGAATTTTGNSGGTGGQLNNPYTYHFGLQDRTTGNIKFGARIYDPTTGTWTQQDTLNAPLNPGNANRYLYAAGNPINGYDPTGLTKQQADDVFDIGTGVAVTVASGCAIYAAASAPVVPPAAVPGAACAALAAGTAGVLQGVKAIYDGVSDLFS